jgi:hypothetical protein
MNQNICTVDGCEEEAKVKGIPTVNKNLRKTNKK